MGKSKLVANDVRPGTYEYQNLKVQKFPVGEVLIHVSGGEFILDKNSPLYPAVCHLAAAIEALAMAKQHGSSVSY
jgi:hypothetical protein